MAHFMENVFNTDKLCIDNIHSSNQGTKHPEVGP